MLVSVCVANVGDYEAGWMGMPGASGRVPHQWAVHAAHDACMTPPLALRH